MSYLPDLSGINFKPPYAVISWHKKHIFTGDRQTASHLITDTEAKYERMIYRNFSLKSFNTFGLDYRADIFIPVRSEEEAVQLIRSGSHFFGPVKIIGGGSNLLFVSDFHGTIIHPSIEGIRIEEDSSEYAIVSAGAGVSWDTIVEWTVSQKLGGLENLSLIPGTAGAAPIQNIGAYGVEVRDFIEKVRAISLTDGSIREFNNSDCRFGYRDSIFKNDLKGKYLVTKVAFRLSKQPEFNIYYGSLRQEAEKYGQISLRTIREAVIKIRREKLPDPEITGNAGSFFKNPMVSRKLFEELKSKYQQMPSYDDPSGGIKLPAGWLIEQCGWKGKRIGDAGVHEKQALVLVNYGNASGKEIYDLSESIKKSVSERFGIELEHEVEVVGSL